MTQLLFLLLLSQFTCSKSSLTYLHRCRCWVAHPTRTTSLMTDWARLPRCHRTWRVWSVRRGWTCPGGTTPAPPRERTVLQGSTGCSGMVVGTRPGSSLLLSEENENKTTYVTERLPSVNCHFSLLQWFAHAHGFVCKIKLLLSLQVQEIRKCILPH